MRRIYEKQGYLLSFRKKVVHAALALAASLAILGASGQASAGGLTTTFEPDEIQLSQVGETATVTIAGTGVPSNATDVQIQVNNDPDDDGVADVLDVIDATCIGIFAGAARLPAAIGAPVSNGPGEQGGHELACSLGVGETVSGTSGDVMAITFKRIGPGEVSIDFIERNPNTGQGTLYVATETVRHEPQTTNSLSVKGFLEFGSLLFDPASLFLGLDGPSSEITLSATGVPTDSTVFQLQLSYDQSLIDLVDSSVDCAGIVDDDGRTSPEISRTSSTITILCSIGGGRTVSASSGDVLKLKFERTGDENETVNILSWDAETNPGGTAFFDPRGHVPATKNSLAITAVSPPMSVTAPNGGESWEIGSRQAIAWSSTGLNGSVRIELSRDGGATWITLVRRTPNDGEFTWRVGGPATEGARVRVVSNADPSRLDASDGDFAIVGAGEAPEDGPPSPAETLSLTSPAGEETWAIGLRQAIAWSSTGLNGSVRIELSRDGGATWITLVRRTPNDGEFTWTVGGPATEEARVRVTSNADPSRSDTSAGDFTIEGP